MAMAMASTVVSLASARILKAPAVCRSSVAARSSGSVSRLCSSFTGLSLQSWQKSRHTGDISGLSISAAPSVVSPARSVVLTVAKIKTHKASAKRFKVTGSGKIMRRQAFKQHLLGKKNSKRKRRLSKMTQVNRSDYDNVIGALPYLNVKGREQ